MLHYQKGQDGEYHAYATPPHAQPGQQQPVQTSRPGGNAVFASGRSDFNPAAVMHAAAGGTDHMQTVPLMQSHTGAPVMLPPMMMHTGLLPQDNDSMFATMPKKMLYPSPAAGRGRRSFLFVHVILHVVSLVMNFILIAQGMDYLKNEVGNGTGISALALQIVGILLILGISSMSKSPFDESAHLMAVMWFCFFGSFMMLGAHYVLIAVGANDGSFHLSVLGIFCLVVNGLTLGYVVAGSFAGVAQAHLMSLINNPDNPTAASPLVTSGGQVPANLPPTIVAPTVLPDQLTTPA